MIFEAPVACPLVHLCLVEFTHISFRFSDFPILLEHTTGHHRAHHRAGHHRHHGVDPAAGTPQGTGHGVDSAAGTPQGTGTPLIQVPQGGAQLKWVDFKFFWLLALGHPTGTE